MRHSTLSLALLLATALVAPAPAEAALVAPAPTEARPRPLVWTTNIADPAVTTYDDGGRTRYVVTGTGPLLPRLQARGARATWRPLPPAPAQNPLWVTPGDQWGPDVFETDYGWVLYSSAPIAGLAPDARCITAYLGESPTGAFYPVSETPLVCPPRPYGVPAEDQLVDRTVDQPVSGVIDPSAFETRNGRLFLLYKTQGRPATIRSLPLTPDGQHAAGPSIEILRTAHTVENPAMVQRGKRFVMFASEGGYTGCGYRTTYRRSRSLARFPSSSTTLLDRASTEVCGPGGADVVLRDPSVERVETSDTQLFFHGWVCHRSGQACPGDFSRPRDGHLLPSRALYGVRLGWTKQDRPVVLDALR